MSVLPVVVLALLAGGVSAPPAAHPLHLTTAQVAVEGRAVHLRIRLFKNDLEAALAGSHGLDSLLLEPTARHDSLFLEYFRERYELTLNTRPAVPVIVASGQDEESGGGDETIWWVQLLYQAEDPVNRLDISARVLFEWFEDQRNIVRVLHVATDKQRTLYFAAPDDEWASLIFQ